MQRFPGFPACPVCGDPAVNPGTLAVTWWWEGSTRRVKGSFLASARHTGYAGRLHGGLVASLLDECMAWACAVERATYCVTGDLAVRFKSPAPIGAPLEITARALGESWGPYLRACGEVRSAGGALVATATATFSALSRDESLAMRQALRIEPGDLDVLAGEVQNGAI